MSLQNEEKTQLNSAISGISDIVSNGYLENSQEYETCFKNFFNTCQNISHRENIDNIEEFSTKNNNIYNVEDFIDQSKKPPRTTSCVVCKKITKYLCSGCKSVYYCDRECQLKQWKDHKIICK